MMIMITNIIENSSASLLMRPVMFWALFWIHMVVLIFARGIGLHTMTPCLEYVWIPCTSRSLAALFLLHPAPSSAMPGLLPTFREVKPLFWVQIISLIMLVLS